jgi:hypothetical protein
MYEVSFEPNVPPGVDAGPDQLISFLGSATLNGTVVEDGLPNPPGTYATLWSQFSGPGLVTFTDATLEDTTATFSTVGVYVLRLEADDSDRTAFDDITITVSPATNLPPTVLAGPAQTIILPNSATLDGTVADDGLPAPPTLTYSWSVVSGPGAVTFGDATSDETTASFAMAGDYVLRLTAFDSALSAFDDIAIKVKPAFNQAPRVDAGPPQTITLPNSASLNGTVMDDGLPNPPASTTTIWSKISGPGTVNFATASAVDTSASFSAAGVYILHLSANDSELSNHDEVTITVQESDVQKIWLPVVFKNH